MKDVNVVRGLRTLLFFSLLGVLGFKGDACICGGARPQPPNPTSTSTTATAPAGSSSAPH